MTILPDRIHLRDYILSTDIGAFQSERGHDQRLRFNITVDLAQTVIGVDDHVDRILSYDVLTGAVATALADQRYNLLETLAEKIAAEVLAHPRAERVEISIDKLDRIPGALGVTITRQAAQMAAEPGAPRGTVLFRGRDEGIPLPGGACVIVPPAPGLTLPAGGNDRMVALLALDQAGWALAGRLGLDVADSRTELDWALAEAQTVVWAPARMVADSAGLGADPAALALWLAGRLGAARLLLALPPGTRPPTIPPDFRVPVDLLPG